MSSSRNAPALTRIRLSFKPAYGYSRDGLIDHPTARPREPDRVPEAYRAPAGNGEAFAPGVPVQEGAQHQDVSFERSLFERSLLGRMLEGFAMCGAAVHPTSDLIELSMAHPILSRSGRGAGAPAALDLDQLRPAIPRRLSNLLARGTSILWTLLRSKYERAQAEAALQQLDDRSLGDLGIVREQIRHVVRYGRQRD